MRIKGQETVAAAFGVAPKTIVMWQEEGFPVAVRGARGIASEYDLPACITWFTERAVRKAVTETPRDRLARAQAESVEFDLKQKRGQFVPVEVIEPKWTAAVVAAREQLLRTRRRIVEKVERAKTRKEREQAVGEEHEAFLRTLADWRGASEEEVAE